MANTGKVLRRKGTEEIFGEDIYFGLSFYINGVLQNPPHQDIPEDFEEIYSPEEIDDSEALQIIMEG